MAQVAPGKLEQYRRSHSDRCYQQGPGTKDDHAGHQCWHEGDDDRPHDFCGGSAGADMGAGGHRQMTHLVIHSFSAPSPSTDPGPGWRPGSANAWPDICSCSSRSPCTNQHPGGAARPGRNHDRHRGFPLG